MWRRKRKFDTRYKFLLVILVIVFLFIGYLIFHSGIFIIKNIDIQKEDANCVEDNYIRNKSGIKGQSLFLLNEEKTNKNLKEKFICIKKINFSKIIPDKIKLTIAGREAVIQLISVNNWEASASSLIESTSTPAASLIGDYYFVDDEGKIFSKNNNSGTGPKIYFFRQGFTPGLQLQDDSLKKILKILATLKNNGLQNKIMTIYNNLFIIDSLPKIIFTLNGNVDIQIASLQLILQKAKIDGKRLEFIDLRFDKPIIKFAPKKD